MYLDRKTTSGLQILVTYEMTPITMSYIFGKMFDIFTPKT